MFFLSNVLDSLNIYVWRCRKNFSPVCEYEYDTHGEVINNYTPIIWTPDAIRSLIVSGICGAVLGVFVAVSVNTVLAEIPTSPLFTLYFGVLFIIIGGLIIWKISSHRDVLCTPMEAQLAQAPRRYLLAFGCLNVVTGFVCLFLKRTSFMSLPIPISIIVYMLLGMSAAFALTYGIIDLINFFVGLCRPESSRPLVESILQIYVVVISSLILGILFGLLSSLGVTVNDAAFRTIRDVSHENVKTVFVNFIDDRLCISIGLLFGGMVGLSNEYIGRVEACYNKSDQPIGFDEDI